MELEFLPHAESQLKERNISFTLVSRILNKPDQTVDGYCGNRKVAQKIVKAGGKKFLYRVVFTKEEDQYVVITVYRTSKIKKYSGEEK